MKRSSVLVFAFALSTAGPAALAKPVQMTDAQLDTVAAGQLVQVVVIDAVDINNVLNNLRLAVPVNAAVAAGVLSSAPVGAVATQGVGINQGRNS